MKQAKTFIGLATLAVVVAIVVSRKGELSYHGTSAREWLRRLSATNDPAVSAEARNAVRALDTNITQMLITQLEATDSALHSNVTKLLKAQDVIPVPSSPAEEARRQGMKGFEALGKSAV